MNLPLLPVPQEHLVVTRCITEWSSFETGYNVNMVFTTPSTKAFVVPRLLFAVHPGASNVGEILTSYQGGGKAR